MLKFMNLAPKAFLFLLFVFFSSLSSAQSVQLKIAGLVLNKESAPIPSVTVTLLRTVDSSVVKLTATDVDGRFVFEDLPSGAYLLSLSSAGFEPYLSTSIELGSSSDEIRLNRIVMQNSVSTMGAVTITSKKRPMVELKPGSTIINVDASVTNVGATALEVLEKSPGVSVDRNGTISVKGRQNVLILIDGKQTYLPANEVANLLGSMPASQIDQIEVITNPSAKYDAAGSTGIIEIRTKKSKTRGFNGSITSSFGQGIYPKNNNTLLLNLREGRVNLFLNYSTNANENFADLYAIRWYNQANNDVVSILEQPSYLTNKSRSHNLKLGVDYYLNNRTSLGLSTTGLTSRRQGRTFSNAIWMDPDRNRDSVIETRSTSKGKFENIAANLYLKHSFAGNRELSADVDMLRYELGNDQFFENVLKQPSSYTERFRGEIPSTIKIITAKTDYSHLLSKSTRLETGMKVSQIKTENIASYFYQLTGDWTPDYGKTNNFLYDESIQAVYANISGEYKRWTVSGGLRYERTAYDAVQLGNIQRKDSSFSRRYDGLFPTAQFSYKLDSVHTFTASSGRRIDRPAFQKLNPFVVIINKYTYESGNPYFVPQYTWNTELSHSYKEALITTLAYGITRDYFSQIFISDTSGTILYTQGNLGRMRLASLSVATQLDLAKWWSFSGQATVYNKRIEGFVWNNRVTELTQFNININNQFRFGKGWGGEFSGFFITRDQELQEITDPTGQIGIGFSKQVLKNKGVIKANARDIFYSQSMRGWTTFNGATEYFRLLRDTRVFNVAFTYRFGKAIKAPARRTGSGADDEMKRVNG